MEKSITATGFNLTGANTELIETKLKRISYAEDLIVNLTMRIKYDNTFKAETTVNFKWGTQAHVACEDADFAAAVNKNLDMLDQKIVKEKEKKQSH